MIGQESPRPNYVRFEVRAVEDRARSLEEGRYIPRDVVFAIVTPAGTRDRLEKEADEWLKGIEEGVKQERIPAEWLTAYRNALENFRNGLENPETGTSIKDWPVATPSQIRILEDLNIRTVEDVAAMHDEALSRIGIGARALKERAKAWLESANDIGKIAGEIEKLRSTNSELEARNTALMERLEKLEKAIVPKEAKKPPEKAEV